jgi:sugar/nucleoside kinase (ribokinase family)
MSAKLQRHHIERSEPLDYLVIGHVTADLDNSDTSLGGTAAFSGLTAQALGLNTGIITASKPNLEIESLKSLWVKMKPSKETTTFKNISDGIKRTQFLYHTADRLTAEDIPDFETQPAIVHLGPVANEVDAEILKRFPTSLKCLTPQGWFRNVNSNNEVVLGPWENAIQYLQMADVAVISQEDVQYDENKILRMAEAMPVFAVTENYKGARIYWHNDARYINAPEVKYVDDTGAGDIFATAFFYRYFTTRDPWEAGQFAVKLASWSVTRKHLDSIPTSDEIQKAQIDLIGR